MKFGFESRWVTWIFVLNPSPHWLVGQVARSKKRLLSLAYIDLIKRQLIKIVENIFLLTVLYNIFWCHFFLSPGSEHGVGREFFICEDTAFVTPVCPRLVFGNSVLAHLVKYCIQPLKDRTFWQDFTVSPRRWTGRASVLSKFLRLRQIHDPSDISPALDNALSTLLSCCTRHFFPVRVLSSFTHLLPVVTPSNNDSKQIVAATSFRISRLFYSLLRSRL